MQQLQEYSGKPIDNSICERYEILPCLPQIFLLKFHKCWQTWGFWVRDKELSDSWHPRKHKLHVHIFSILNTPWELCGATRVDAAHKVASCYRRDILNLGDRQSYKKTASQLVQSLLKGRHLYHPGQETNPLCTDSKAVCYKYPWKDSLEQDLIQDTQKHNGKLSFNRQAWMC